MIRCSCSRAPQMARACRWPLCARESASLPLQFTLDDSRAMAPTAKISALNEVIVNARFALGQCDSGKR